MKLPCCKKEISEDSIWDSMESDSYSGVTNKSINCPLCQENLTVFLMIDSVELE